MRSPQNTDKNSAKVAAVETRRERIARLFVEGNQRAAEAQRLEMSRRAEPKAGFVRMSKAAALLNAAGGYRLPLNGLEIASFNRARLDPTTSAPTAPKATTATTAATKAKQSLTLAQKIARLTPEARAALKARLDAFNAGKPKATTTKSKPTVEAVTKPMKATVKPAAPAPASTIKVSKGSRWSVALGKLANLSLGRAAL
jgi:hypothetical protein